MFDVAQLEYLLNLNSSQVNTSELLNIKTEVLNLLRYSSHEKGVIQGSIINRIYYLDPLTTRDEQLVADPPVSYPDALNQLAATAEQLLESDFIVIDYMIKVEILDRLTEHLLTSTIWFDNPVDHTMASYHDDGLYHPLFTLLAKVVLCLHKSAPRILKCLCRKLLLHCP